MNATDLYFILLDKQRKKEYEELNNRKGFSRGKYGIAGQLMSQVFNSVAFNSAPPVNPSIGDIYRDDMDGKMFVFTGAAWSELGTQPDTEAERRHRALVDIMEGRA